MLWTRPAIMWQLLALLLCSELVRTGLIVALLPLWGPGHGLSAALIGTVAGAHYLMDALCKGPLGYLGTRWGLARLLLLGGVLGLLTLGSLHFGAPPAVLVVLAGLWGVAYAALWPGVMHASQELARPERTARALALTNLSVAPAILAGSLGVAPLVQHSAALAWQVLLGVQGLAVLLALGLQVQQPPTSPAPKHAGWQWSQWGKVAQLLPAALAQTLAPGLLMTLFYPLLSRLDLQLADLAVPGALAGACFALTLWLAGRVADRRHPLPALLPGLGLLALTFALAARVPVGGGDWLWLLGVPLGCGYGAFLTGWNGLVSRVLPAAERGAGWGVVMAVEALGYALGPLLGGLAWSLGGQGGVFGLGAGLLLCTALYYLAVWARPRSTGL